MKMTRIDQIRIMSVSEMADLILNADYIADETMGFCKSTCDPDDCTDGAPKEQCRKCVIRWLMEEV